MNKEEIENIVQKKESSKLEFKREWYRSINPNQPEIYKDIISLANGDIKNIGKPSFLIIGVKERKNGENIIFDTKLEEDLDIIKKEILQNLRNFTTPHIINFDIEYVLINNINILVLEIPQHPYLIKLKKNIYKNTYRVGDVLYRSNEDVAIADYELANEFQRRINIYKNNKENANNKIKKKLLIILQRKSVYYTNVYTKVLEKEPKKFDFIVTETYKNMSKNKKLSKFLFFHKYLYGACTNMIKKENRKKLYHIFEISSYESGYYSYDLLKEEEIIYVDMPHLTILYDDIRKKLQDFLKYSVRYLDASKDMKNIHHFKDIKKEKESKKLYLYKYQRLISSIESLKKSL